MPCAVVFHRISSWSFHVVVSKMTSNKCIKRELKHRRGRRLRERHLKIDLCVSADIFQLFQVIMLAKCALSTLNLLNWSHRFRDKKTKLKNCLQMLMSSTQLQNVQVISRSGKDKNVCEMSKNKELKKKMQICEVLFAVVIVAA